MIALPDIDGGFRARYLSMCERLQCAPLDLLGVAMSESGVRADACNPHGFASGLWQMMPDTALGLGWGPGDCRPSVGSVPLTRFRALGATGQLYWFEPYFAAHRGKLVSAAACYVATFLPADLELAGDPDALLVQKDGRRGWAYSSNSVFDANHDYCIQVRELDDAIHRNARGERWRLLVEMLGLPQEEVPIEPYDLRTTLGLQQALGRIGYAHGPDDGIPGSRTRGALLLFQRDRFPAAGPIDGIPGPRTRDALTSALEALKP